MIVHRSASLLSHALYLASAAFLIILFACQASVVDSRAIDAKQKTDTLYIHVVGNFDKTLLAKTKLQLSKHFKTLVVKSVAKFPDAAYYPPRKRYIADTIISKLAKSTSNFAVSIAVTHEDISTKKGKIQNYGIMGLGYQPGRACVVSTFRLQKENLEEQFYKLCLHELGHTAGLPHCAQVHCFMRDAEGKNHFNEEQGFCNSCTSFLNKKGWDLH